MKRYTNIYLDCGDYVSIEVRDGEHLKGTILIDPEDVDKAKGSTWAIAIHGYAIASKWRLGRIYLHRVIMAPPEGFVVDHINHDILDNRKANLRNVTYSVNNYNQSCPGNVREMKGRFYVYFTVDGAQRCFGGYDSKQQAQIEADKIRERLINGEAPKWNERKSPWGDGICFRRGKTYGVRLPAINGVRRYLGEYKTLAEAVAARDNALQG